MSLVSSLDDLEKELSSGRMSDSDYLIYINVGVVTSAWVGDPGIS